MRLCMFSPVEAQLERGWPGRIVGDTVVQLAAQTLQAFFTGGSASREHAQFPLAEVLLRAPVLEPPAIRLFDGPETFVFANPAAIRSPGAFVTRPHGRLDVAIRLAALIGFDSEIAGFTGLAEFRAPELAPPKDRDFALVLGPVVETDIAGGPDWEAARLFAVAHTRLRPGDLLGGPVLELYEDVPSGPFAHVFDGLGELGTSVA